MKPVVMLVQVVAFPSAGPQLPFDTFRQEGDVILLSLLFFIFVYISQTFLLFFPPCPGVLRFCPSAAVADGNWGGTWRRPHPSVPFFFQVRIIGLYLVIDGSGVGTIKRVG